ncbi:ferredoxin [Tropicibacter sp. R15_0]|uniref:ferredoxin n=1 Tax=Tropicibacter sp. R15_0 TaxID=2821101 RepID=UPI001ADCD1BA|nr:ferredoxin [Tropicibacter sp. R15_0]MBO9465980.1 ferredoxin [Tropicibacter sp. R15_0]
MGFDGDFKKLDGEFRISPDECVTCGCCIELAPLNIDWVANEENPSAVILKQPETEAEVTDVARAADNCMVDCIKFVGQDPRVDAALEQAELKRLEALPKLRF